MSHMDRGEIDHLMGILRSMNEYAYHHDNLVNDRMEDYDNLSEKHKKAAPKYGYKLQNITNCVHVNHMFLTRIIGTTYKIFPELKHEKYGEDGASRRTMGDHHEKVNVTLTQMMRDWSEEGKPERDMCYKPIIDEVLARFPHENERANVKVLVPGCGLGRLPWEFARLGFEAEGNEFTYFMLLAGHFIMHTPEKEMFPIYPYATHLKSAVSQASQMREIKVPDERTDLYRVNMQAGDFLHEYRHAHHTAAWDVISTCFFMDTAKNSLKYMENLSRMIKPGGYWINFGPLLYHFSELNTFKRKEFTSLELSYEEMKGCFAHFGFKLVKEEFNQKSSYNRDQKGMTEAYFNCVFFVCVRVEDVKDEKSLEKK